MRQAPLLILAYNRPDKMSALINRLRSQAPPHLMIAVDAIAFHSIAVFGVVCACADVVVRPAVPSNAAVASPTARVIILRITCLRFTFPSSRYAMSARPSRR